MLLCGVKDVLANKLIRDVFKVAYLLEMSGHQERLMKAAQQ